ncbi:MAG TPA: hypothetical protein VE398_19790 [Acidobacteriota bacterium]|nr:hypothetical protein [Acidobacteriota bacterium]
MTFILNPAYPLRNGLIIVCISLWCSAPALKAEETGGRWAILVAGVSGDPEFQKQYLQELSSLHSTLQGTLQFGYDHVYVLFDDPAKDPSLIKYKSTRENLEKVCREIAGRAGKDDLVFVFIEGHGSFDQNSYKLNLVGPDPNAEELAAALYSIPALHFVVVNATSASGASLAALSGKGKIVITATKSGSERNQTHLGQFFVEALKDNSADVDKSGRVSVLEAFTYAVQKVEEHYAKERSLQTEHPVLDDNGDGQGQAKPGPENGEGLLARTTYLDAGAPLQTESNLTEEQREQLAEARSLEQQIEALKYAKAGMNEAEYEKKLENLLLRLAQVNAKLRKK